MVSSSPSDSEVNDFIIQKKNAFTHVIYKTIKSVQNKRSLQLLHNNDVKLCVAELSSIQEDVNNSLKIDDLQHVNNRLSTIFQQYGTEHIDDLLMICYGPNKYDTHNDRYTILKQYFTPMGYKVLPQSSNKSKIQASITTKINLMKNATMYECFEHDDESSFFFKTHGLQFILHDENKHVCMYGYIDDIPTKLCDHPFINTQRDILLKNYPVLLSPTYALFVECVSIRELLIFTPEQIVMTFKKMVSKTNSLHSSPLVKVIKEFLISDITVQRFVLIALLIDHDNAHSQYLAYLLYDLLQNDNKTKQCDNEKQVTIYYSLPHPLKQVFKNAIKSTLTYLDTISDFDENKIPIEQQICLLKTTDNVKEKAMQKLKDIKSRSEDSGSKSRQYLDGLLKIPFSFFRTNKIRNIHNENVAHVRTLHSIVNKHSAPDTTDDVSGNFSFADIYSHVSTLERTLLDTLDTRRINNILKNKTIYNYIKRTIIAHPDAPNCVYNKKSIVNLLNNSSTFKSLLYDHIDVFAPEKRLIHTIKSNRSIMHHSINQISSRLDAAIHGHHTAKRQIERVIGQWISGDNSGYCLGFEGPPGIGKTSLAKKGISYCLLDEDDKPRPFSFIALGGSSNASTIDGHNYTYVGSTWGKIVDILMETKCMNPIIFIDELDKVSKTEQGKEIIGVLTHITDYTQNDAFQDKYFTGVDIDLSKVLFIFSYNDPSLIDKILLDRIHRVKFDSVNFQDKIIIAKTFILPELLSKMCLVDKILIPDEVIQFVIDNYTSEPGVRKLKEIFFEIIGEINLGIIKQESPVSFPFILTIYDVETIYLKRRHKNTPTMCHSNSRVGIINGLWANAYSQGGILPIQATHYPSNTKYDLKLTGSQGDVMQESMNVARSVAYSLFDELNSTTSSLCDSAIHVHCPDGSTPKDGPSAGTAIALTIYSLLTNKYIRHDVALTGEITLSGAITKIGGLEFKILGAYKANVRLVIYPLENQVDFDEFIAQHPYVNDTIRFVPATNIRDILEHVFI